MIRKFRKNRKGSMAIEFAILGPILFLLMFGIIETSYVMLLNGIVERATRESARSGITGYAPPGVARNDYVKQVVQNYGLFMDPSRISVQTKVYQSYQAINQSEPYTDVNGNGDYNFGEPFTDVNLNTSWDYDMGTSGAGSAGDIVVYTVSYPWKIHTPFVGRFFGGDGNINISASMVVRNEPY